jgi:hypothetical protein
VAARSAKLAWLLGWGVSLAGCAGEPAPAAPGGAGGGAPSAGNSVGGSTAGTGVVPVEQGGTGQAGGAPAAGSPGTAGSTPGGSGGSGMVGVFVAQGHYGRITRSCDDGLTFPYNHSEDDDFRCFIDEDHDCDHSEFAGRGLAFGAGAFVATWGWGHPGTLQRSTDGKVFDDVMSETPTFADVAYGNGVFVACGNPTRVSSDGATWEPGGELSFDFNYRGIEFVPAGGGTFIVTGESGAQRAISLSHDGKTWTAASQRPDACGQELRGIAGSDQIIIVASGQGHTCRSLDGGEQWQHVPVTDRFTSPPIWTGSEFWIYSGNELYRSADGAEGSWTHQAITPKDVQIGNLARSPDGTLLAANDGWMVWYEKQHLYRSTDGLAWTVLDAGAFTGSHPINFVSYGYVPASPGCGAP